MARLHPRSGFTLTELLIVIAIIATLTSISAFALRGAQEDALETSGEAQIDRIDRFMEDRWEEYYVRRLPFRFSDFLIDTTNREEMNRLHQDSIVEMILAEFPSDKTQLYAFPSAEFKSDYGDPQWRQFRSPSKRDMLARKAGMGAMDADQNYAPIDDMVWSPENMQAECLYLILSTTNNLGEFGTELLRKGQIGDTDEDGYLEVLDPWGEPVGFRIRFVNPDSGLTENLVPVSGLTNPTEFDSIEIEIRSRNLEMIKGTVDRSELFPNY